MESCCDSVPVGTLFYTLNVENGNPVVHTYRAVCGPDGDGECQAIGFPPYVQEVVSICDFDRQSTKPFRIQNGFSFRHMMLDRRTIAMALATWPWKPLETQSDASPVSATHSGQHPQFIERSVYDAEEFHRVVHDNSVNGVQLNFFPTVAQFDELRTALHIRSITSLCVTDDHIHQLRGHPTLSVLNVSGSRITDECASSIASIRSLVSLNVSRTAVSDRFCEECCQLENLMSLSLAETRIGTDVSFHIATKSSIRLIDLSGTGVGDNFFTRQPEAWTDLVGARLEQTKITDATVALLGTCHNLRGLGLQFCNVTWNGLTALFAQMSLTELLLRGVRITFAEYELLRQAIPRAAIRL